MDAVWYGLPILIVLSVNKKGNKKKVYLLKINGGNDRVELVLSDLIAMRDDISVIRSLLRNGFITISTCHRRVSRQGNRLLVSFINVLSLSAATMLDFWLTASEKLYFQIFQVNLIFLEHVVFSEGEGEGSLSLLRLRPACTLQPAGMAGAARGSH